MNLFFIYEIQKEFFLFKCSCIEKSEQKYLDWKKCSELHIKIKNKKMEKEILPNLKISLAIFLKKNYSLSIVSNSNLISFQTSQAAANSGLHLHAERITSPPSRAKSRPSLRA